MKKYKNKLQKNMDKLNIKVGNKYLVKSDYRVSPFADLRLHEENENTRFECMVINEYSNFYTIKILPSKFVVNPIITSINKNNIICGVVKMKELMS